MHASKLIGMLLDAHINLKTIDIVPLLYSPKMVRLLAQQQPRGCTLATHRVVHAFLPQLLDNVKEAKEVLAASLASSGPSVESLGGFEARAYRFFFCHPLCIRNCSAGVHTQHVMLCACISNDEVGGFYSYAQTCGNVIQAKRIITEVTGAALVRSGQARNPFFYQPRGVQPATMKEPAAKQQPAAQKESLAPVKIEMAQASCRYRPSPPPPA